MINRKNWKLMKSYLEYRKSVDQLSEGSLRIESTYLRYILEWAGEVPFKDAPGIRPTLPEHLLSVRVGEGSKPLTRDYSKKILATARRFFEWLSDNQKAYRTIKRIWIRTLKAKRIKAVPKKIDVVSYDDALAIAQAPAESLREQRIQAAAVFWYLSGIRIGAFVSLPILAVDIEHGVLKQHPDLGGRTKNGKHATTYLLQIPELMSVVRAWDDVVRTVLPEEACWFAHLSPRTGQLDLDVHPAGYHRPNLARRELKTWLEKVGLAYHSPHKFRHGHIQYGVEHAKDRGDIKAISLNVMHDDTIITDKVYSRLRTETVQSRINGLSEKPTEDVQSKDDFALLQEFISWKKSQFHQ